MQTFIKAKKKDLQVKILLLLFGDPDESIVELISTSLLSKFKSPDNIEEITNAFNQILSNSKKKSI